LLLIEGIDPIYATRKESPHYLGDGCGMGVYLGPEERRRFLAEMLSIAPETIPWKTELSINIEFESLEQFNHAVLTLVNAEQARYQATVAALADRGLLTSAEAQESLPQLELRLIDMRGQGAAPIADIPNLPSHVELASVAFLKLADGGTGSR
jgi:hypothetical protein